MRTTRRKSDPVLITDAEQSFDDELQHRKKVYTILMAVHLVGFTLAGIFAWMQLWWLALALVIATGALPWVAVVLANDHSAGDRQKRAAKPTPRVPQQRNR